MKNRKRVILLICLGFSVVSSWAQKDTVFYNKKIEIVALRKDASSYSVSYPDSIKKNRITTKTFSISGQIWSETPFLILNKSEKVYDGIQRTWNRKNGNLKSEITYKNNKLNGSLKTYWSNEQLRRDDVFKDGKLLTGKCYTKAGADTTYYEYDVKPSYPGGQEMLYKYLRENLEYPEQAKENGIEGTVMVRFYIEKDGSITDVTAYKSSGNHLLDAEAVRVVRGMQNWIPGKIEGKFARKTHTLPVNFFLNN